MVSKYHCLVLYLLAHIWYSPVVSVFNVQMWKRSKQVLFFFFFLICLISWHWNGCWAHHLWTLALLYFNVQNHYSDVIMKAMASQITSVSIVCSTVCSGIDKRKHQGPASLAFVRGLRSLVDSRGHEGPVTRTMFPFDDVIMMSHGGNLHSQYTFIKPFPPQMWNSIFLLIRLVVSVFHFMADTCHYGVDNCFSATVTVAESQSWPIEDCNAKVHKQSTSSLLTHSPWHK